MIKKRVTKILSGDQGKSLKTWLDQPKNVESIWKRRRIAFINTLENILAFQGRDGVLTGSLKSAHQRFGSVFKNRSKE